MRNLFIIPVQQFAVKDGGSNYWALLLVIVSMVMVSGNVLVIMSVAKERALQNMTNLFIVSLAIADLLVAALVMPFTIYALVSFGGNSSEHQFNVYVFLSFVEDGMGNI